MTIESQPSRPPLSEAKRLLLEKRMRGEFVGALRRPGSVRPQGEAPLRPSQSQVRLWEIEQLDPAGAYYNLPLFVRVRGPLVVGALELSINETVRRHTSLRMVFPATEGRPSVRVMEELILKLEGKPGAAESDTMIRRLALEEIHRPFDLTTGPLIRVSLWRLDDQDWLLLLTTHTIVCDPPSLKIVAAEISALYDTYVLGQPSRLQEPTVQCNDYVHWQQERVNRDGIAAQLDFWKSRMASPIRLLALPYDRPRPASPGMRASRLSIRLPLELAGALQKFSQSNATSLFAVLLCGYQILLSHLSGAQDIAVGCAVSNLQWNRVERPVGLLLDLAVFRTSLAGSPSYFDALQRVRRVCLDVFANLDAPFGTVAAASKLGFRGPATSFPQIMFDYATEPLSLPLSGCRTSILPDGNETMKFDLDLTVTSDHDRMTAELKYSSSLFDSGTVQCMLEGYVEILRSLVHRTGDTIPVSSARPAVQMHRTAPAPLTPDEERVAAVWRDELGMESLSPDSIFWEMGGNSLAAVRIVRKLELATGAKLALADFYRTPSIRAQAAMLAGVVGSEHARP